MVSWNRWYCDGCHAVGVTCCRWYLVCHVVAVVMCAMLQVCHAVGGIRLHCAISKQQPGGYVYMLCLRAQTFLSSFWDSSFLGHPM